MSEKKKQNYIDGVDFYREILKYRHNKPNNVGDYLILISRHMLGRSEFNRYPQYVQDELTSFSLLKMTKGLKSFKIQQNEIEGGKKSFAYFSRACYLSFLTELSKYYKRKNLERSLKEDYISRMESEFPELGRKLREDQRKNEYENQ